jgi:uracil-DNA glycosylase
MVPLFLVKVSVSRPCFKLLLGPDFSSCITITLIQHRKHTLPQASRWIMSTYHRDRHNLNPTIKSFR